MIPRRLSARQSPARRFPALALVSAVAVVPGAAALTGCGAHNPFASPQEKSLHAFAEALGELDVDSAAAQTTDPAAALADLRATLEATGATSIAVDAPAVDSAVGTSPLPIAWTLPGGHSASTEGTVGFGGNDGEGAGSHDDPDADPEKIAWTPAVLDGGLEPGGHLAYADAKNYAVPVLDKDGQDLMTWSPVTSVSIGAETPTASLDGLAELVRSVDPTITADSLRGQLDGAGEGGTSAVISLRQDDAERLRPGLEALPGVTLSEQGRLLTTDRRVRTPALAGLPDYWQEQLDSGAGWSLSAVDSEGGARRIAGDDPAPMPPVRTSIDVPLQAAAQSAVDARTEPASIVAIEPSSGGILAVAQNAAADREGAISLTGLFPPGSTFKTVTTSATLAAGNASPDSVLPCPARVAVDGREIPNDEDFDLGDVPLHTAFAQSCNTTQALLSSKLGPEDMRNTAESLGLGVDFDVPGVTTVTGSVPSTQPGPARVEAAIGQGEVTASPFGIALMEASVANGGAMVTPQLIQGTETKASASPPSLSGGVAEALRTMMRETVSSGSARSLARYENLGGKTGTAEVDGGTAHGWFAGAIDNVAFCSFIEGGDSSGPAVTMSGDFLDAAGEALYR